MIVYCDNCGNHIHKCGKLIKAKCSDRMGKGYSTVWLCKACRQAFLWNRKNPIELTVPNRKIFRNLKKIQIQI